MNVHKAGGVVPEAASHASTKCRACSDGKSLPFGFPMAFQPIVDIAARRLWGYEALVRGTAGEGAAFILDQVEPALVYGFDQACRVNAVELASQLFPVDPKNTGGNCCCLDRRHLRQSLEDADAHSLV